MNNFQDFLKVLSLADTKEEANDFRCAEIMSYRKIGHGCNSNDDMVRDTYQY